MGPPPPCVLTHNWQLLPSKGFTLMKRFKIETHFHSHCCHVILAIILLIMMMMRKGMKLPKLLLAYDRPPQLWTWNRDCKKSSLEGRWYAPGVSGGLKTTVTEPLPISQWQYHCQSKRKSIYNGINAQHLKSGCCWIYSRASYRKELMSELTKNQGGCIIASFCLRKKTLFFNNNKKRNPPSISLGVSLEGSTRILDFDKVQVCILLVQLSIFTLYIFTRPGLREDRVKTYNVKLVKTEMARSTTKLCWNQKSFWILPKYIGIVLSKRGKYIFRKKLTLSWGLWL